MTRVRPEFREIAITHRREGKAIGWFDSSRIERAVANLVLNACEAVSPQSGQVLVTTKCSRFKLQIDVWDNVPGFQLRFGVPSFNLLLVMASRMGAALGSPSPRKLLNAMVERSTWSDAPKHELFLRLVFRSVIREGSLSLCSLRAPLGLLNGQGIKTSQSGYRIRGCGRGAKSIQPRREGARRRLQYARAGCEWNAIPSSLGDDMSQIRKERSSSRFASSTIALLVVSLSGLHAACAADPEIPRI